MKARAVTLLLLLDLVLAGGLLYVQVVDHGGITIGVATTTVVVTSTVTSLQRPYDQVNVTSVSCSASARSCTISLSNDGGEGVRFTACIFQQAGGGVGNLTGAAELPGHSQASVTCAAPDGMTDIAPGAKVLGAVFFAAGTPLLWSGVWR